MHTGAIYRMQCHSRNSQIAPCSEQGSYNINTLLLNSKTMSMFYLLIHVMLYLTPSQHLLLYGMLYQLFYQTICNIVNVLLSLPVLFIAKMHHLYT